MQSHLGKSLGFVVPVIFINFSAVNPTNDLYLKATSAPPYASSHDASCIEDTPAPSAATLAPLS
jgi:hypothetical protein